MRSPTLPVVMQHSRDLELGRIEYRGRITNAEVIAILEYQLAHQEWLAYDTVNLITADAEGGALHPAHLDAILANYATLFAPTDLLIFRRSAWINLSPALQPVVDHWINRRNTGGGQTLEARQFKSFAETVPWLKLPANAATLLETGEGFQELARYEQA
ncbi:MAG: hypothetical protein QM759_00380 [Terricaulis sp.]